MAKKSSVRHRKIPSSVAELRQFRRKLGVPDCIGLTLFSEGDAVLEDDTVVYAGQFLAGMRLPLSKFAAELLSAAGLCPGQISMNGWRILRCCENLAEVFKVPIDMPYFCAKFDLRRVPTTNGNVYGFPPRIGEEHPFPGLPTGDNKWKVMPVLVTGPWQSGRCIPNRPQIVKKGLRVLRDERIYKCSVKKIKAIDAEIKDAMGDDKPHWKILHSFKPEKSSAVATAASSADSDGEHPSNTSLSADTDDEHPSMAYSSADTDDEQPCTDYSSADTDDEQPSTAYSSADTGREQPLTEETHALPAKGMNKRPHHDSATAAQLKKTKGNAAGPQPSTPTSASANDRMPALEELTRCYREKKQWRKKELADLRAAFACKREATLRVEKEGFEQEAAKLRDALHAAEIEQDKLKVGFEKEAAKLRDALHTSEIERDKLKEDVDRMDATLCEQREEWRKDKSVLQNLLSQARSVAESRLAELRLKHTSELEELRSRHDTRLVDEIAAELIKEIKGVMASFSSDDKAATGGEDGFG